MLAVNLSAKLNVAVTDSITKYTALINDMNIEHTLELDVYYHEKQAQWIEISGDTLTVDYVNNRIWFNLYNKHIGNIQTALEYAVSAYNISNYVYKKDAVDYIYIIQDLSDGYALVNDYDNAIKYNKEAYNLVIGNKAYPIDDKEELLDSLCCHCFVKKQYKDVIKFALDNIAIKKHLREDNEQLYYPYKFLHTAYVESQMYDDAIKIYELFESKYTEYIKSDWNVHYYHALCMIKKGRYAEALASLNSGLENFEETYPDFRELGGYYLTMNLKLLCYYHLKDEQKIKELENFIIKEITFVFGANSYACQNEELYLATLKELVFTEDIDYEFSSCKDGSIITDYKSKEATQSSLNGIDFQNTSTTDCLKLSDSLFAQGMNLYKKQKYAEAIPLFLQSDSLMTLHKVVNSSRSHYGNLWVASCHNKLGNDSIASNYSVYYKAKPVNRFLTEKSDSIYDYIDSLGETCDIEKKISLIEEALNYEIQALGKKHYWCSGTLSELSGLYKEYGDTVKALSKIRECLDIQIAEFGVDSELTMISYLELITLCDALKDAKTIRYYTDILTNNNTLTTVQSHVIRLYAFKAICGVDYSGNKEYLAQLGCFVLNSPNYLPYYSAFYSKIIHGTLLALSELGKSIEANDLALKYTAFYDDNSDPIYERDRNFLYLFLAHYYYSTGEYDMSISYNERALKTVDSDTIAATLYANLSSSYNAIGRREEALSYAKKAVEQAEKENSPVLLSSAKTTLSSAFRLNGMAKDALLTEIENFKTSFPQLGICNETLCSLLNMGFYYENLGNVEKAKDVYNEVILACKKEGITKSVSLAYAYVNLARVIDSLDYAIDLMEKGYNMMKEISGEYHHETLSFQHKLSLLYYDNNNWKEGLKLLSDAETKVETNYGVGDGLYLEIIKTKAELATALNKKEAAYDLMNHILTTEEMIFGKNNFEYIKSLIQYSRICHSFHDVDNVEEITDSIMYDLKKTIGRNNLLLTESEKFDYINQTIYFVDDILPDYIQDGSQKIIENFYDAQLFRKSLILNSFKDIQKVIDNSRDSMLITNFEKLNDLKRSLDSYVRQYSEHDAQTLRDSIEYIENKILSDCKKYIKDINNVESTWRDIQTRLGVNDVAIEFAAYNDSTLSSGRRYCALIVTHNCKSPIFMPLCDSGLLEHPEEMSYYSDIWSPILTSFTGYKIKNIFFSPYGKLHNLSIEYASYDDGTYLTDHYRLFRLSSTKELLNMSKESSSAAVLLIGGLNYDMAAEEMIYEKECLGKASSIQKDILRGGDLDSYRMGFDKLPATLVEVSDCAEILAANNVECMLVTGNKGTEDAFKTINGTEYGIIHLATHGMHINAEQVNTEYNNRWINKLFSNKHTHERIEDMLNYSFLVMSGGNMLPQKKDVPNDIEDGLLTAREISQMDLKKTSLVVLSACQSGLGTNNNEGSIGLQYGFKKAGVKTLLVSLGNVDDNATQILMTEFYKNISQKHTISESLHSAQMALRTHENSKFHSPDYWTPFVLIDAVP